MAIKNKEVLLKEKEFTKIANPDEEFIATFKRPGQIVYMILTGDDNKPDVSNIDISTRLKSSDVIHSDLPCISDSYVWVASASSAIVTKG